MSLQLILGSCGSGKSYKLYKEIITQSIEKPSGNYIIIVPEQFTMQTQKDIVTMHPNNGSLNIDIVSFLRLAHRIFTEVGHYDKVILDDLGKSMMLRKVFELKKHELEIFNFQIHKPGFISEIKSLLSELYQYNITEDKLLEMAHMAENKPLLYGKMMDIITIFKQFKEMLKDKYLTTEEVLDVLRRSIPKSDIIKNSVIYLDGFTGFTPSQYKLLEELMKYAKKIIITITIDPKETTNIVDEEFKLFHISKKTIHKLNWIASQAGIEREKDIVLQPNLPYRFINQPILAKLEKNLFRFPYEVCEEETNAICIHPAKDPNLEIEFVVKEITKLIREENLRYKDIAIITGDMETYGENMSRIFKEQNIPCFLDNKKSMLTNPFAEMIRSALEVIAKDFTYESIFRFLRTGMGDLTKEEIDILENYVLALGIRGNKIWCEEWKGRYRTKEVFDYGYLNEIRQRAIKDLMILRETLINKKSTLKEYTISLYNFILAMDVQNKLNDYAVRFERENQPILEKEYKQIFKLVMDLLDKLVGLLGDSHVSIKEYEEILAAGLGEIKIGVIPPSTDQIMIGDIERTRLKDIKILFLVGVNEGVIPKSSSGSGILSELDRQLFIEQNIEMAPTQKQETFTLQYYLYLNLTKPSERIYLSFSKKNSEGKSIRPSYLIEKIRSIFPNIAIVEDDINEFNIDNIYNPKSGLNHLMNAVRNYKAITVSESLKELFHWYFQREEWTFQMEQIIKGAFYSNNEKGLSKAVAGAIYGKELLNSVTRLEQYAACGFAHFLRYGLLLDERTKYQIRALDMGNLFHNAIEIFSRKLTQSPYSWNTIPDNIREEMVEESVTEVSNEYGNWILMSTNRNQYITERIKRIVNRTTWTLCEHLRQGKFIPSSYEVQFSMMDNMDSLKIQLSKDEQLVLNGRIDRLDTYEDESSVYVKIIDYKSGHTSFDMDLLYYGLQMQLIVYINAAMELEGKRNPNKKIIPAGVLYYTIDDPIVEKTLNHEDINKNILKELKMDGLINDDLQIVKMFDQNMQKKSDIIPVQLNKDGTYSKTSHVANTEQFKKLSNYVNKKIETMGREILDGYIDVNPYEKGKKTACDYCNYSGICGFDNKLYQNDFRRLKSFNSKEIWDKIDEGVGKE